MRLQPQGPVVATPAAKKPPAENLPESHSGGKNVPAEKGLKSPTAAPSTAAAATAKASGPAASPANPATPDRAPVKPQGAVRGSPAAMRATGIPTKKSPQEVKPSPETKAPAVTPNAASTPSPAPTSDGKKRLSIPNAFGSKTPEKDEAHAIARPPTKKTVPIPNAFGGGGRPSVTKGSGTPEAVNANATDADSKASEEAKSPEPAHALKKVVPQALKKPAAVPAKASEEAKSPEPVHVLKKTVPHVDKKPAAVPAKAELPKTAEASKAPPAKPQANESSDDAVDWSADKPPRTGAKKLAIPGAFGAKTHDHSDDEVKPVEPRRLSKKIVGIPAAFGGKPEEKHEDAASNQADAAVTTPAKAHAVGTGGSVDGSADKPANSGWKKKLPIPSAFGSKPKSENHVEPVDTPQVASPSAVEEAVAEKENAISPISVSKTDAAPSTPPPELEETAAEDASPVGHDEEQEAGIPREIEFSTEFMSNEDVVVAAPTDLKPEEPAEVVEEAVAPMEPESSPKAPVEQETEKPVVPQNGWKKKLAVPAAFGKKAEPEPEKKAEPEPQTEQVTKPSEPQPPKKKGLAIPSAFGGTKKVETKPTEPSSAADTAAPTVEAKVELKATKAPVPILKKKVAIPASFGVKPAKAVESPSKTDGQEESAKIENAEGTSGATTEQPFVRPDMNAYRKSLSSREVKTVQPAARDPNMFRKAASTREIKVKPAATEQKSTSATVPQKVKMEVQESPKADNAEDTSGEATEQPFVKPDMNKYRKALSSREVKTVQPAARDPNMFRKAASTREIKEKPVETEQQDTSATVPGKKKLSIPSMFGGKSSSSQTAPKEGQPLEAKTSNKPSWMNRSKSVTEPKAAEGSTEQRDAPVADAAGSNSPPRVSSPPAENKSKEKKTWHLSMW